MHTPVSLIKKPTVSLRKRGADSRHRTDIERRQRPSIDMTKKGR